MAVSYIVTVYNKESYLDAVLKHVEREFAQTGGEIILVNDGSTDGSLQIVKNFAAGRSGVIVHDQENCGVAAATNVGFSLSSFPFIRFVDSDDLLVPGSTKRLMKALDEHNVGFAFGHYGYYSPGKISMPDVSGFESTLINDPLWGMIKSQLFIPSAALAIRDVVESCFPLPEKYRTSQDYMMGIRFAQKTAFAEIKGDCCLAPEKAPGRLSASQARMYTDTAHILADEIGKNGDWSLKHKTFAVRRTAGRALNYARRSLNCGRGHLLWLAAVKLASSVPFPIFNENILRRISETYAEALKSPDKYP